MLFIISGYFHFSQTPNLPVFSIASNLLVSFTHCASAVTAPTKRKIECHDLARNGSPAIMTCWDFQERSRRSSSSALCWSVCLEASGKLEHGGCGQASVCPKEACRSSATSVRYIPTCLERRSCDVRLCEAACDVAADGHQLHQMFSNVDCNKQPTCCHARPGLIFTTHSRCLSFPHARLRAALNI